MGNVCQAGSGDGQASKWVAGVMRLEEVPNPLGCICYPLGISMEIDWVAEAITGEQMESLPVFSHHFYHLASDKK